MVSVPTRAFTEGQRTVVARFPFETGRNPYQRLLYESLADQGVALVQDRPFTATTLIRMRPRVGALHFNWRLDRLHGGSSARRRVAVARLRLRVAQLLRYRIVWTVHELALREADAPLQPMEATLARVADAFLCHDPAHADRAAVLLGIDRSKVEVIPHGPLSVAYPAPRVPRETTRERLGIGVDETVFLSFGAIAEYKKLALLLSGFEAVRAEGARLVIAGQPLSESVARSVRAAAAGDPRVVLLDRRVPDSAVRELFEASDVFVSPRSDGWSSGSLVLALNLGLPAVVAACPHYLRLIADGRAGWAFERGGGPEALTAVIESVAALSGEERREAGRIAAATTPAGWAEASAVLAGLCRGRVDSKRVAIEPEVVDA